MSAFRPLLPFRSAAGAAGAVRAQGLDACLHFCFWLGAAAAPALAAEPASAPARAALSVSVVQPKSTPISDSLQANGNVAAWQEAIVGAETAGLRLAELRVEVGEQVRRGQLLARFASETVQADLAQAEAGLAEAEASAAEAGANAQRARSLGDTGVLSAQQMQQYLTAEQTALARVAAQRAAVQSQTLRLAQTQVLAPDDGVISARSATLGAVAGSGQELFRLIRGGRLEWRAEVAAADLARLRPGQAASITSASGQTVAGKLRKLGPTVDPLTRNALVYVDLLPGREADVRAGMFARGEFRFESRAALTLPASALLLRDGFQCVMAVGANGRVKQTRVKLIARQGDRVAIEGLAPDARVVERGGAFLSDGDLVKVVPAGS